MANKTDGQQALWTLNIPDFFPLSPNRLIGKHKMVYANHRRLVRRAIYNAIGHEPTPKFTGRPSVLVMRLYGKGKRPWDQDNVTAAIKPIVDTLRGGKTKTPMKPLELFEDDTTKHIKLLPVVQRKSPDGRTWTRIMVSGTLAPKVEVQHGPGQQIELDAQIDEALHRCD